MELKYHLLREAFPDPQTKLFLMLYILAACFFFFLSIYHTVITSLFGSYLFLHLASRIP